MRSTLLIARKELASFFDSLMAYMILVAFLGLSGFFTWWYGTDVFLRGLADLSTFFSVAYWTLFLFIPAITMRTIADERRSGTLDLLLTKAVTDRQVVAGKFLACLALIALALAFTLPYWVTIAALGRVDHGALACGYLALLFMSAAYIAIGIYASSLTNNQIVAFVLATFLCFFFFFAFDALSRLPVFFGKTDDIVQAIGIQYHYESMSRGVLDTRDIIYFLSVIAIFMAATVLTLGKRRW